MMLVALLCVALCAFGCGNGGGGSSGSSDGSTPLSATAVDLPPGQTTVQLAWEPSWGNLDGYMAYRSDNEGPFQFVELVVQPTITISGEPGDSVRILVIALGATGNYSTASPPSAPIRFHAAIAAAASAVEAPAGAEVPAAAIALGADPSSTDTTASASAEPVASDTTSPAAEGTTSAPAGSDAAAALDRDLLDRLLRSNVRLPRLGLDSQVGLWIQSIVDERLGAGVSLVGAGTFDSDEYRDLVWRDAAGQLFLSDGASLAQTDDLAATLTESVRLMPAESFVALVDLSGDGVGDYLIEDATTNEVWIVDGVSGESTLADDAASAGRLLAVGDFDADGRPDLLWQHDAHSLSLTHPGGGDPSADWSSDVLDVNEVFAVADLDGDGRDDLLTRSPDGQLEYALSTATAEGLGFEWIPGPASSTAGLDFLATLDLDQDSVPEIAWLNGETVEIWDVTTGPQP